MQAMKDARRSCWQRSAPESSQSGICLLYKGIAMRRRTLLSASLGLGALAGLVTVGSLSNPLATSLRTGNKALEGLALYSGSGLAFGTTVTIKVLHDDPLSAEEAIQDALREVRKIDALMSLHQEHSQVFQLNLHGLV